MSNKIIQTPVAEQTSTWAALPVSFSFRTLTDINEILSHLEGRFPLADNFVLGVKELMVNAVEHGNLGIGYRFKTRLLEEGRWLEEITHRLTLPENAGKEAMVKLFSENGCLQVEITDAGNGFDYQSYITPATESAKPNGRGLVLAHKLAFDHVQFLEGGRRVQAKKSFSAAAS